MAGLLRSQRASRRSGGRRGSTRGNPPAASASSYASVGGRISRSAGVRGGNYTRPDRPIAREEGDPDERKRRPAFSGYVPFGGRRRVAHPRPHLLEVAPGSAPRRSATATARPPRRQT